MKMSKTVCILRGDEELEIEVDFDISPLIPASGPSFNSPGEPAEGGEIEVESVKHNGVELAGLSEAEDAFIHNYLVENFDDDFDEVDFDDDSPYWREREGDL